MEFLTNLWNNQPNVIIGLGVATAVLLGIYIFLLVLIYSRIGDVKKILLLVINN